MVDTSSRIKPELEEQEIKIERDSQLISVLKKSPQSRSPQDVDLIESYVDDNEYMIKYKNTQQMRDLCRKMRIESFKTD